MTSSEPARRLSLVKPDAWPSRLGLQWEEAREPKQSLFHPARPAAEWQPATLRQVEQGLGKLLAVLHAGGSLSDQCGVEDIVNRANLTLFVAQLAAEGLQLSTYSSYLNGICLGAKAMVPRGDWKWIGDALGEIRAKIPRRQLAVDSQITTDMLREAGKRVFAAAVADTAAPELIRARRARNALIVAFLAVRQFRRKNLSSMKIGTHVLIEERAVSVRIPQSEMKMDKRGYEADWPKALAGELEIYLRLFRPMLVDQLQDPANPRAAGDALWVSQVGTMMDATGIYKQVRKFTNDELGTPVNPQRFRHIAACTIVVHRPELVDVVSEALCHADPRSREIYMRGADQLQAVRRSHRFEDRFVEEAGAAERTARDARIGDANNCNEDPAVNWEEFLSDPI